MERVHRLTLPTKSASTRAWWSPNGKWIASCHGDSIALWDALTGKLLRTLRMSLDFPGVAWSPDSSILAVGGRTGYVALFDVAQGIRIETLKGNEGRVVRLKWSADGISLAGESDAGIVCLWNTRTAQLLQRLAAPATRLFTDADYAARYVGPETVGQIELFRTSDEQAVGAFLMLRDSKYCVVSANGHFRGSLAVDRELVYVAVTDEDRQITLTPAEFEKRYGWKNNPSQVKLIAD